MKLTKEILLEINNKLGSGNFTEFFTTVERFMKNGEDYDRILFHINDYIDASAVKMRDEVLVTGVSGFVGIDSTPDERLSYLDIYTNSNGNVIISYDFISSHIQCYDQGMLDKIKESEMGWKKIGRFNFSDIRRKKIVLSGVVSVDMESDLSREEVLSIIKSEIDRKNKESEKDAYFTNIPKKLTYRNKRRGF